MTATCSQTRRAFVAGAASLLVVAALDTADLAQAAKRKKKKKFKDKDCKDFKSQKKAQKFFKRNGGPKKDPHNLDSDNDGKACEDLP